MIRAGLCAAFLTLTVSGIGRSQTPSENPAIVELDSEFAQFDRFKVQGFEVFVHQDVASLGGARYGRNVLELSRNLLEMIAITPKDKLPKLREATIWVNWDFPKRSKGEFPDVPAMAFYRSPSGLGDGSDPEKRGGVVISAKECLDGISVKYVGSYHRYWILHEFAHAYHYSALGPDHSKVNRIFSAAKDSRLYIGTYASTNSSEYFAELSVAYLGRKRDFPHSRLELKDYDPRGFMLMREVWGEIIDNRQGQALPVFRSRCCVK
jgi:hypothetical protein